MSPADFITVCRILETTVLGISGFHADCTDCPDWRCHRTLHESVDTAIRCAERHQAARHP